MEFPSQTGAYFREDADVLRVPSPSAPISAKHRSPERTFRSNFRTTLAPEVGLFPRSRVRAGPPEPARARRAGDRCASRRAPCCEANLGVPSLARMCVEVDPPMRPTARPHGTIRSRLERQSYKGVTHGDHAVRVSTSAGDPPIDPPGADHPIRPKATRHWLPNDETGA